MKLRLERALSPLLGLLLFLQGGILVTGGIVRLTGSGLGCPTWPRCTETSINPEPTQLENQLQAWIEFGNRLIAVVLVLVALICLITVLILKRRDIRALAIGQLLGILAQIPLGGITVLTHLNPFAVASHFLLSIILIAAATSLYDRRTGNGIRSVDHPRRVTVLIKWMVAITALVIIIGTGVTGSGPHAGDFKAPRFDIPLQTITRVHGNLVFALLLILAFLFVNVRNLPLIRRKVIIFTGIVLVQGLIGIIQYDQGLPEILVGAHLIGVVLVWVSAWRINLLTFKQRPIGEGKRR